MLTYPVIVERDGDGFMASFPDIPEALTSGRTQEEALDMAKDALETAFEFYFDDKRIVPLPSKLKAGQDFIELTASLTAKILLLNEMVAQKVRPTDLAKLLKTSPQEVNRLVDLKHQTKIDRIAEALRKLGKKLELSLA
jgi:antitoxin HicB